MYNYYRDEGVNHPHFIFTTDSGAVYAVSFTPYDFDSIICKRMYSMAFAPIDRENPRYDGKVSRTIIHITKNLLLSDKEIVLKYLCDITDDKQRQRHITFNKWFNMPDEDLKDYEKYNRRIDVEDSAPYYISFVYNKNVFSRQIIEEEVHRTLTHIDEEK